MNRFKIIALILSICLSTVTNAKVFNVKASIDSLAMFIGDQANLTFVVEQSNDQNIILPELSSDVLGKLEIVEFAKPDTVVVEDKSIVTHKFLITAFDSTLALIPSLPFVSLKDTQYSNPVTLKVIDIPVDTTQMAIADIKAIEEPPFDYYLLYTIIGIVILVVAIIILIICLVQNIKRKDVDGIETEYVDPRSPYEIAIENLELLKSKNLYHQGKVKEYFTELTDILRIYLSNKYNIFALESTTEELLYDVKDLDVVKSEQDFINLLKGVLSLADLVKFAKFIPELRDCEIAYDKVISIVEIGKTESSVENEVKEQSL